MGEELFASGGDSRSTERQAPAWGLGNGGTSADERTVSFGRAGDTGPGTGSDVAADVTRRLQGRLDRLLWLLHRIQTDPLQPEPPGMAELMGAALRMRRDAECLLLMSGVDPADRDGGPHRIAEVLAQAAASAEDPLRVDVGSTPPASLTAEAATELAHVLAELVDHVTAVYPGARIDLACRAEEPGGIVVDVRTEGASRHDPDGLGGRAAMAAAERLAAVSRGGLVLHRPAAGTAAGGPGSVATVHCPGAVVTWAEPERPPSTVATDHGTPPADLAVTDTLAVTETLPISGVPAPNGSSDHPSNGDQPIGRQVDELFGPLLDLAHVLRADDAATPIFQAIASAWFRDDPAPNGTHRNGGTDDLPTGAGPGSGPLDWETPSDLEWQAAAARAARSNDSAPLMSSGLPRRRPGNQLVPPLWSPTATPPREPPERVPDRVRERLTTLQEGLRHGRHRAPVDVESGDAGLGGVDAGAERGWDAGTW